MPQKIKKKRITKKEWYDRGGFANSALFRLQSRGGAWRYYVNLDMESCGHNWYATGAGSVDAREYRCAICGALDERDVS